MLISLCTAIKNRLDDLRQVMPARIAAANASPPVEIAILDCGSTDGLPEYMDELIDIARLDHGNFITYKRIEREYWHVAKAYNMAVLMGKGEYIFHLMADASISRDCITHIRTLISDGCAWGMANHYCGNKFFSKDELIDAGGFDERFELYGPEDKDLHHRLLLRGSKFGQIPDGMITEIYTPDDKKLENYSIKGTKREFSRAMRIYYQDNIDNEVTVANQGKEWGTWTL